MRTKRIGLAPRGIDWITGLALAVTVALVSAAAADAQSVRTQYSPSEAPSGGASGLTCVYVRSTDGLLNAGDSIEYPGDYSISPGASVVIDDSDNTQGTLIDEENAQITEGSGGDGIRIAVSGDPMNVSGGDGVLSDKVCNSIVASTGISGDPSGGGDPTGLSVLPDTGGSTMLIYMGLLAVAGGGLVLLRRRALRSR